MNIGSEDQTSEDSLSPRAAITQTTRSNLGIKSLHTGKKKRFRSSSKVDLEYKRIGNSPHQGGLRLLGPPSGRGADGGARNRDKRVPADLWTDSQATVPLMPLLLTVCISNSFL
ncbi:hypothetical protein PoB_000169000 [Plakobranchus ocellatus]|uniref:Uncharacterized protein n=1 Tax=Plakobranchus ocellatus TaxID=259542 RepID=A0AAV3XWK9_9GAST|nr:hypothetical protein PoB_000169000 [Plakobranchus ocellatus]